MSNAASCRLATLSLAALSPIWHWQWTRETRERGGKGLKEEKPRVRRATTPSVARRGCLRARARSAPSLVWMLSASRAQLTSDNERPRVNTMTERPNRRIPRSRWANADGCLIRLIPAIRQTHFPEPRLRKFHGSIPAWKMPQASGHLG